MKRAFHQTFCDAQLDAFGAAEVMVATKGRPGVRACSECGATQTPQWRQGPAGPQTLCNACGVRYSRLMRKGSKSSRRRPIPLHDDASDDSVSDDTSKGTTIMLMPPPSSSPAGSPARSHPFQQASLTPFSHAEAPGLAASRVRRHGLITTGLPAGLAAPEAAAMAAALPPVSSSSPHAVTRLVSLRASSSCGLLRLGSSTTTTTNLPALSQPMETKPQVEPEDTDCEAALNLLSMAAGHAPCAVDTLRRRSSEEDGAQKLRRVDFAERRERDAPCQPASLPAATTPTSTQQVQQRQHQLQLQRQQQLQQQACSSPGSSDSSAAATQLHLQLQLQQQRQQQVLAAALQERQLQQLLPASAAAAAVTSSAAQQQLRGDAMQALLARIARASPGEAAAGAADADQAVAASAGSEPAPASQLDGMQALMSRLNADEQRTLRALCTRFDVCFQEMVAAQAACEAVAQILRAKQEAARAAQLSARAAAQLLLLTATELSVHRTVQQTSSTVNCSSAAATTPAAAAAVAATAATAATLTTAAATPTAAAAVAAAEVAQPAGAHSGLAGASSTAAV